MDVLFHLLIPFLLLAFFKVKHRFLPALLILAVVPDMEKFLGGDRFLFHNFLFFALVVSLVFVFFFRSPERNKLTGLSAFLLGSHFVLDLGGPMAFLYPFDSAYYWLKASLTLQTGTMSPFFSFSVLALDSLPAYANEAVSVVSIFLAATIALMFLLFGKKFQK